MTNKKRRRNRAQWARTKRKRLAYKEKVGSRVGLGSRHGVGS